MYNYIIGKITGINLNHIILETNQIGYQIYVANPYSYKINEEYKIYIFNYIREDENTLYGFKATEEKDLFLKLYNVKGLGPKIIMPMLATGSVNGIIDAIERENILYLNKFPKIGDKLARQIILDLKGKLVMINNNNGVVRNDELSEVLLSLGYKNNDIKQVLTKIDYTQTMEKQIKEALKYLLK